MTIQLTANPCQILIRAQIIKYCAKLYRTPCQILPTNQIMTIFSEKIKRFQWAPSLACVFHDNSGAGAETTERGGYWLAVATCQLLLHICYLLHTYFIFAICYIPTSYFPYLFFHTLASHLQFATYIIFYDLAETTERGG